MSSYARRRRKRRRREEEERRRKERVKLNMDKNRLASLLDKIDQMSDEGKIELCKKHGKDLIDLTTVLTKIPKDKKGRSYSGTFNEQGDRLYGHFFFGTDKEKMNSYTASANSSTPSIALIIHPDCTYSAYPGDYPEDQEMKVTNSADILSAQFALASWAARVDPEFDEKIKSAITVLKTNTNSPKKFRP